MWNATERPARGEKTRRRGRFAFPAALAILLLALTAVLPPAAAAQQAEAPEPATGGASQPAAPQPAVVEETPAAAGEGVAEQGLAGRIEARYRVVPRVDGLLLVPRQEIPGIRDLEVSDGEVRVNGEAVSANILTSWLGDEAVPLLALADLGDDGARQVLGISEEDVALAEAEAARAEAEEEARRAAAEAAEEAAELGEPPPPPEPEEPETRRRHSGATMKFGSSIVIQADEVASEAGAIGGSVTVLGQVRRDVVAVGGDVEVTGEVGGDVTAVFGDVVLGPDAVIEGNVVAVGGEVEKAPGARIGGDVNEVGIGGIGAGGIDWDFGHRHDDSWFRQWKVKEAYWNLVGAVFLGLLVCLALLISRPTVERVTERLHNFSDVLVAGVVGLAVQLLLVPLLLILVLLLVITIVGCLALPLLPFALLALAVAALFGYAGVSLRLGRWLAGRFGWRLQGPYLAALLGVGLIEVWRLFGESLDVFGGPAGFFAAMFMILGAVVEYVAWSVSLGAILMNLFQGRRRGGATPPPAPGLPPAPPTPPPAPPEGAGSGAATAAAAVQPAPADSPPAESPPPDTSEPAEVAGAEVPAPDAATEAPPEASEADSAEEPPHRSDG
jgi:hypothetical protein